MRVNEYGSTPGDTTGSLLPVLLVEPDGLARRALSALLTAYGFQLAGAVAQARDGLDLLREQHIGILFTEIALPDMPLGQFVAEARRRRGEMRVVAITGEGDADVLADTLRIGVSAILSKYTPPQVLMPRLGAVFTGGLLLDEITAAPLLAWIRRETGSDTVVLPAREREVLELVLQGHSTRSAARVLGLAESTVKSHAAKAAARLGMKSSRQAAMEASRRGLIAHGMIDLREDAAVQETPDPYRPG
jgi:two-component system nitrate/nitrite response regulator NarL